MAAAGLLVESVIYLGAAVIAVPISKRFGLGSVVGYLIAGIIIGPWGLHLIDDAETILHFSEFSVVLLLFLIGLELNPSRLWNLCHAIFGLGALQVVITGGVIAAISAFFINDLKAVFIIAIALALSSTAMAMQLVNEKNLTHTGAGQSGFAVLLFQDLAVIPLLALMPLMAHQAGSSSPTAPMSLVHIVGVIALILIGGRYLVRHIFRVIAKTGLREIFTAFALFLVIGIALLMQQVGLSIALGSFLAGVVLADSKYRQQLEIEIEPFKGLLMGLFFIAVGMSTNLGLLGEQFPIIIGLVGGILLIKFAVLLFVGKIFHMSGNQSLLLAALVSQVGEFAFVIFGLADRLQLIDPAITGPLIVVVSLSMVLTPLLIVLVEWIINRRMTVEVPAETMPEQSTPVILVGVGRMGQVISRMLMANDIHATVIDNDPDQIELSRHYSHQAYYGDARRLDLLEVAGIEKARLLILACDDPTATLEIVDTVKAKYPELPIVARARNRSHAYDLFERGVKDVERETFFSSLALTERVLKILGYSKEDAYDAVAFFRKHDADMLERLFELRDEPDRMRQSTIQSRKDFEQLMSVELGRREQDGSKVENATGVGT